MCKVVGVKDGSGRDCSPTAKPTSYHKECSTAVLIFFSLKKKREAIGIIQLVSE